MVRKANRSQGGAVAVELAFLASLILLLLFGVIEFGRLFNAQIVLTHSAREGVRVLAITQDPSAASDVVRNSATSLDPAQISISSTACVVGDPVELTASYPFELRIPIVGTQTLTLDSTGVMRCGG